MKKIKFRFPTLEENYNSAAIYDETYEFAQKNGVVNKNTMSSILRRNGIFTLEMQKEMDKIEAGDLLKYPEIQTFEDQSDENKFVEKSVVEIITGEKIITVDDLLRAREIKNPEMIRYRELSTLKSSYMRYTCEGLADRKRIEHLLVKCSYNADTNKPIWSSMEKYYASRNVVFALLLTSKFVEFIQGLNQTVIRKIARHHLWRTKWVSATKIGSPVFRGSIAEWDTNKTFLCYWSNFLDNVYSGMEIPEEFIIKDDKLLDNWLEAKNRENKQGSSLNSNSDGVRAVFKKRVNPVAKKE